jgi:hypothetical protein
MDHDQVLSVPLAAKGTMSDLLLLDLRRVVAMPHLHEQTRQIQAIQVFLHHQ